ncbi:MAG: Flp pilus assembly protein CpaB, partial [Kiloniellaceae bacterium]
MKPRAFVMLGLAVILAGVSVALARTWLHSRLKPDPAAQAPGVATTRIVVAAAPLRYGDEIRREHLRLAEWPATAVPDGAFGAPEQVLGEASAGPRVALRAIEANEPILAAKITGLGGRASLSTLIAPGMRATTIRVNDVNGVAGFVLPGDRVDVLLTRDQPGDRRGANPITDILLQNMKVLGVDQDAGEGRERAGVARAVTLEVTSIQAQKLTLAQRLGTLSLALRHVNTADAERPRTITVRDLRVGKAEVARPATLPGKDGAGP